MTPLLYSIVDQEQLLDMLHTFHHCVKLPVQLLDEDGNILCAAGDTPSYCSLFQKKALMQDGCTKVHADASKRAVSLGEPYLFACHANLNHIIFPLMNQKILFGSILAGPFLMEEPDSTLIEEVARHYTFTPSELLELYDESKELQVITPASVTALSKLLYYLFAGLIPESKQQLVINQTKLSQQSRINETIQRYKDAGVYSSQHYPYDKEKELILKIKTGNIPEAKALLNDLLGYVFFTHGSNLEFTKARALELCALLSRAAAESSSASESILKVNNDLLSTIPGITDLDELCFRLQESIDAFNDCMLSQVPTHNSEMIKQALQYIAQHYAEPLSLEQVAARVHLTPAYFSTLFKRSTGTSFKEHLNMVRVEESKRLLSHTEYSLLDIAVATGFDNQSYYTKVFKKYTGLTPGQFR